MNSIRLSAFADEAASSTEEQIAALLEAGIRYIDPRKLDGHVITDLPLAHTEAVRRLYDDAQIQVSMFGSPIGKTDITDDFDLELERLDHLGRLAPILGCRAVRIFSFHNRENLPHDRWRESSLDRLKRLKDRAASLGLVLYHENEGGVFGESSENVLAIAALRDDVFRLIYDFANYLRTGEPGTETWRKLEPVTDAFHLKDKQTDGTHVPIGQGDTSADVILSSAIASGWSGPMTLEPHLFLNDSALRENPKERRRLFQEAAVAATAICSKDESADRSSSST